METLRHPLAALPAPAVHPKATGLHARRASHGPHSVSACAPTLLSSTVARAKEPLPGALAAALTGVLGNIGALSNRKMTPKIHALLTDLAPVLLAVGLVDNVVMKNPTGVCSQQRHVFSCASAPRTISTPKSASSQASEPLGRKAAHPPSFTAHVHAEFCWLPPCCSTFGVLLFQRGQGTARRH